jgi:hypothetical protein
MHVERWGQKTSSRFEDQEFNNFAPSYFRDQCREWKIPSDFFETKERLAVVDEDSHLKAFNRSTFGNSDEKTFDSHFWKRGIISALLCIFQHDKRLVEEENFLWNLIWPKGKDGKPALSPSGLPANFPCDTF